MDFVPYLVPKLRPNFRKFIREIPATSSRKSGNIWNFWHKFGTRNHAKSIKKFTNINNFFLILYYKSSRVSRVATALQLNLMPSYGWPKFTLKG